MKRTTFTLALTALAALAQPAAAQKDRSIALILDASGSMNGKLADGAVKIDAAKKAVSQVISKLPAGARLSFRAYGHQSDRSKKNCKDTQLLVDFAPSGEARDPIEEKMKTLKARGYTPISYVLALAAKDVGREGAAQRSVVLVSDGKETCSGDPCAVAKALAAADSKLVVHTIGFGVDAAAKYQLQCIAKVARGKYFEASSTQELASALGTAAEAPAPKTEKMVIKKQQATLGSLRIKYLEKFQIQNKVLDAESGESVDWMGENKNPIQLKPGIYNVTFYKDVWKSVVVEAGKETVLEPGVLKFTRASGSGNNILDAETGEKRAYAHSRSTRLALIPSTYTVTFGKAEWRDIEIKPGQVTVLAPGKLVLKDNEKQKQRKIYTQTGAYAGYVDSSNNERLLPPGKYALDVGGGERAEFEIKEGTDMEVDLQ